MIEYDLTLIDWSRLQFAVTAIYHWFFVPLTLGLAFLLAFMETIYVRTGNEEWKPIIKFWMTIFGINFAVGVATGIILEFEFGTNWSNYSWFVGDIFGAPLAIEGIMAFFMESIFIAVMFFGWNKVSKRVHLLATWLVAIGASLSALWILVANGWMQNPVGMQFNPETMRNEMVDFWQVFSNPMAMNKFFHTIFSAYLLASVFVIGVSSWFLIKGRETVLAKKSIYIASIFGLCMSLLTIYTGDTSSKSIAKHQPMKLAAAESLYEGKSGAGLSMIGLLRPDMQPGKSQEESYYFDIEIPYMLSFLGFGNFDAFVPGINDLVYGNEAQGILSAREKMARGREAIGLLRQYSDAKKAGNKEKTEELARYFNPETHEGNLFLKEKFAYFGYGYLNAPEDVVPNVPLTYYSFRIMVGLGFWFILLFVVMLFLSKKDKLEKFKPILWLSLLSIPLVYLASQAGWVVAEVGRQPWVIQDLMPTAVAVSRIDASSVQITFWLFVALFSILAIAEVMIMLRQIKKGSAEN
jgi:cytochrome d ubiquinol oxidase subunit I